MEPITVNLDPTFKLKGGGYIKNHNGLWELFKPKPLKVGVKGFCSKKRYETWQGVHERVALGTDDLQESLKQFNLTEEDLYERINLNR